MVLPERGAPVAPQVRVALATNTSSSLGEETAEIFEALPAVVLFELAELSQARGHGEGIPRKGPGLVDGAVGGE